MKFHYYPDTDSLYIELTQHAGVDSIEAAPGIVIDVDENGKVVGIDIDHASQSTDLYKLETEAMPFREILMHP
jgi:uncharacterized protein YuzE